MNADIEMKINFLIESCGKDDYALKALLNGFLGCSYVNSEIEFVHYAMNFIRQQKVLLESNPDQSIN